jgi:hypothetical protein
MAGLGYEFVSASLGLQVFPVERPAVVRPVTRIETRSDERAVPAGADVAAGAGAAATTRSGRPFLPFRSRYQGRSEALSTLGRASSRS